MTGLEKYLEDKAVNLFVRTDSRSSNSIYKIGGPTYSQELQNLLCIQRFGREVELEEEGGSPTI